MASLSDIKVHTRFKLSGLWAALMFCYIYGDYFGLYVPGKLSGMIGGEGPLGPISQSSLVITSLLLALPAIMVAAPLLVGAVACRWSCVALGIFYTVIVGLTLPGAWNFYIMLGFIEMAISLSIAWIAWRWPRHPAVERNG